jgi:hypothetical protein
MSEIISRVTPNNRAAAGANDRALAEAIERWRAAPPGSSVVLPLGQVWLSQPLVLGDTDAEIEFEGGALAPARHDVRPNVRDESIPDH